MELNWSKFKKFLDYIPIACLCAIILVSNTDAECCGGLFYGTTLCCDLTPPYLCCGNGDCNFFCCNCDFGCRGTPGALCDCVMKCNGVYNTCESFCGDPVCSAKCAQEFNACVDGCKHKISLDSTNNIGLQIFSSIDENRDGNISKSEFDVFIQAHLNESMMGLYNFTSEFEKMDIDKNGLLTIGEVDKDTANYLQNNLDDFKTALGNDTTISATYVDTIVNSNMLNSMENYPALGELNDTRALDPGSQE